MLDSSKLVLCNLLTTIIVSVPLPSLREAPNIQQIDGDWRYDSRNSILEWSIVLIDASNRSGSLEFVIPAADPSSFFPISARFSSSKTFSDLKVTNILPLKGTFIFLLPLLDGEPEKKLLGDDTGEVKNLAVAEDSGHGDVVPNKVLELGGARVGKVELEATGDIVKVKFENAIRK
nr:coatomer subunit delta [Ipomoea trifida]